MEGLLLTSPELEETANEELQILQTQYPHRFSFLKSELQSFISLLREHHAPPTASETLTQVSSTRNNNKSIKKRKNAVFCGNDKSNNKKVRCRTMDDPKPKRKDRVDIVLERAHLCLQKIRDFKSSLFLNDNDHI